MQVVVLFHALLFQNYVYWNLKKWKYVLEIPNSFRKVKLIFHQLVLIQIRSSSCSVLEYRTSAHLLFIHYGRGHKLGSVVLVLTDGCFGCSRSGWGCSEVLHTSCIVPSSLTSSSHCMSVSHAAETIVRVTDLIALSISIDFTKITSISCTVFCRFKKTEYNYLKNGDRNVQLLFFISEIKSCTLGNVIRIHLNWFWFCIKELEER